MLFKKFEYYFIVSASPTAGLLVTFYLYLYYSSSLSLIDSAASPYLFLRHHSFLLCLLISFFFRPHQGEFCLLNWWITVFVNHLPYLWFNFALISIPIIIHSRNGKQCNMNHFACLLSYWFRCRSLSVKVVKTHYFTWKKCELLILITLIRRSVRYVKWNSIVELFQPLIQV